MPASGLKAAILDRAAMPGSVWTPSDFLDLGGRDIEIARCRAAPERALADRKRQRIHHAHERNDAAGLAIEADRLADAADIAPIGADAAAAAGGRQRLFWYE